MKCLLAILLLACLPAWADGVAVGPQYDTMHVYVAPADLDAFVSSFVTTFGGTASKTLTLTVTPVPSKTLWRSVSSPVGTLSVFGFTTPIPYPFGAERTGYLVTDMDAAVQAARAAGATVLVAPFPDAIGRDTVVLWPGGIPMQLYWHTQAPHAPSLATVPENRVYLSSDDVDAFVRAFVVFSGGTVVSDTTAAPGIEIGRPGETFRRIRIESSFGKMTVLATDGHLPYPYGREQAGFEVSDLDSTLAKARGAGARVVAGPYSLDDRHAAVLEFPGGFITEVHAIGH